MAFSKQQLQKFAHLIRIEISDEKLSEMKIDSVIEWLDKLQKIDTTNVVPMLSPSAHSLPRRSDIVTEKNSRDSILKNAPDDAGKARGYFAVPKVMDE
ncbi:MAG: Asp-tRNA(Asn)/Glu-tRNA(Gln) amidotransferase subunit GatC [Alphaproteobacteria bacterium]|jgi:aspartyl-tRNA(Asn)/glutamyl-tRNA(Gln) amidotransferase subunit C|nr:Asp-tRNA(Asn)/Glu-tRNA(Gln) amidotransferase subunit GatC [Alphaproteobacteria bacterium]MBN2675178.1 Asp-tRNA(Asn)/Glu-tRNA(Gln) amidotransferase subunit GatC [Alphaproteobacteria bacterium]